MTFVDEFGVEWVSIEDAKQARVDALLYGTMFVKRDENGRLCRIDPTTVEMSDGSAKQGEGRA